MLIYFWVPASFNDEKCFGFLWWSEYCLNANLLCAKVYCTEIGNMYYFIFHKIHHKRGQKNVYVQVNINSNSVVDQVTRKMIVLAFTELSMKGKCYGPWIQRA